MSGKVRVGIVGTSGWADVMYLPSLQSHPSSMPREGRASAQGASFANASCWAASKKE
jgi:hypothetical protein